MTTKEALSIHKTIARVVGLVYLVGLAAVGGLLVYEHSLVRADDLSKVNAAFFTVNGFVSIGLFLFTATDLLFRPR